MPPPRSSPIDWQVIEIEYRTGSIPIREIARRHNVRHPSIIERANKLGWTRDLQSNLQRHIASALNTQPSDQSPTASPTTTGRPTVEPARETEIIKAVAGEVVQVIRSHRKEIAQGRGLLSKLMQQLDEAANIRPELETMIVEATPAADDPKAVASARQRDATRRGQLMRAVSLPQHASTLRDLCTAMSKVIEAEREAFNIGKEPPTDDLGSWLDSLPDPTPETSRRYS